MRPFSIQSILKVLLKFRGIGNTQFALLGRRHFHTHQNRLKKRPFMRCSFQATNNGQGKLKILKFRAFSKSFSNSGYRQYPICILGQKTFPHASKSSKKRPFIRCSFQATNNGYVATYVESKKKNVLTSKNLDLSSKTTFSFQHFKATVGLELKLCCDSEKNCPWKSDLDVSIPEKSNWASATATCPEGTKKVRKRRLNNKS